MPALIDPTTGRPAVSGPNGEGGASIGTLTQYAQANGLDPRAIQTWTMPDGRQASYIPGVAIQNGNRAALGLPALGNAASTAPGADAAQVQALIDSTKQKATTAPTSAPRDFTGEASLLFPWIPAPLRQVFVDAWSRYGDPNLAMAALRRDASYDQFFAGNRNADGTTILPEAEYLSTMEGYDRQLTSFGLNPGDFTEKKIQALKNGRSPNELGASVSKMYLGIVTKGDEYRTYYAQKYGDGNLSNTALLGAALDGSTSPYEFERRIQAAQVGGAAALNGFDLARQEADRLQSFGLDEASARTLFAKAKGELPTLNTLQQRFADPGDPLTAEHYADALVLNDPKQLEQIGRLYARDRAQYTGGNLFTPDQGGAQRGLLSR